ncbi:prolipoprotein diacylglyceryl transferase [Bacillaceae bacterium]
MQTPTPFDPVAFQLGPISVHWYGIILGTAALVGLLLAMREARRIGWNPDVFVDLLMFGIPAAIIGARTYYVIFEWEYYRMHPEDIIAVWEGGLAIHGALLASLLTAYIFAKVKNLSFWKLADIAAPSIIIGQAIGRWGNFMNQEAHGGPVSREFLENLLLPDWIINQMYIHDLGTYVHPTFLYESVWNLLGFLFLIWFRRLNPRRGELFLAYVIWYSLGRFFIEGMRTDSLMLTETIRMAQFISVLLIVLALFLLFIRRRMGYADRRYLDA